MDRNHVVSTEDNHLHETGTLIPEVWSEEILASLRQTYMESAAKALAHSMDRAIMEALAQK